MYIICNNEMEGVGVTRGWLLVAGRWFLVGGGGWRIRHTFVFGRVFFRSLPVGREWEGRFVHLIEG
jgi:hypothetical protein